MIIDEFACGGGMSEAIEQAMGRHVDHSINHDDDACSMHQANHPDSQHYTRDIHSVDPRAVCADREVGLLWASPDCRHFSRAKGGAT